jgi:uncharacterized protein (DUF2336 family)
MALSGLNWVFGKRPAVKPKKRAAAPVGPKPAYEEARDIAATGTALARVELARREDLEPEILYYFATDKEPEVRRTVAENPGTPLQADRILAEDTDPDVRMELARKIGRMMPELDAEENKRLVDMALEILQMLAEDELPRVRAIISEELKRATNVPHGLIRRLAEDLDEIVSAPVLEYSPLLSEKDLLEIIARGIRTQALSAIARRQDVTAPVSDAVVQRNDTVATGVLLLNKTATISERTFDLISEKAETNNDWHHAMVYRDDLPLRTVLRIAAFVNAALMEALLARNKGSQGVVDQLRKVVRKRIDKGDLPQSEEPVTIDQEGNTVDIERDPVVRRVKEDRENGLLTEAQLLRQIEQNDMEYVKAGLIELSGLASKTFNQMMGTKAPKAFVAIAWKSGLSMDMAEVLQKEIGKIAEGKLLKGKPDGSFPLSDDDLDWYVESFSV